MTKWGQATFPREPPVADEGKSSLSPFPVCARCPKALGISCCEVEPEDKLATLTRADVERISAATGLPARRFVEEEPFSQEEISAYEDRRPLYRGYFAERPVRLTLQRRDGACVFLDRGKGCRLTAEQRPSACRLYPIEVLADGTIALQVDRFGSIEDAWATHGQGCLAVEESESFEALLAAIGLEEADVPDLAEQIRAEVRAHARPEMGTGYISSRRSRGRPPEM